MGNSWKGIKIENIGENKFFKLLFLFRFSFFNRQVMGTFTIFFLWKFLFLSDEITPGKKAQKSPGVYFLKLSSHPV